MAVTKKQDNKGAKKEQGKKGTGRKESAKKDLVLSKDKRDIAKKEAAKKEITVKKEKVNRVEQLRKFLRGTLNELKKVHWPNRREVIVYTLVVLVAVAAVGILIWLFDSVLSTILKAVLHR